MSEPDGDELELQALQRRLDDAFETTRPRAGFEDELWTRMQAERPAATRFRDVLRGLIQGIREVPAVPMAAVAAVLVVVIGLGVLLNGFHGGSSSVASTAAGTDLTAPQVGTVRSAGAFGQLPAFNPNSKATLPGPQNPVAGSAIAGQSSLTWTGQLTLTITSAPVYRYLEPSTTAADQFASGLGAVLQGRPDGFLGSYQAADYTLRVRGTVQSQAAAPAYFVLSAPNMPAIDAAGAAPGDVAGLFLAEHSLMPQWSYTVSVDDSGGLVKVHFLRQFVAPGYGLAHLVDASGMPYGLEVDLQGTQPVLASGPLPVALESAAYPIISVDQAVRLALVSTPPPLSGAAPGPAIALTKAELVYVLVPAGDHSFYEPAFLFSGTYRSGGATYEKRILVSALDQTR